MIRFPVSAIVTLLEAIEDSYIVARRKALKLGHKDLATDLRRISGKTRDLVQDISSLERALRGDTGKEYCSAAKEVFGEDAE